MSTMSTMQILSALEMLVNSIFYIWSILTIRFISGGLRIHFPNSEIKQAGAELGQAQLKLRLYLVFLYLLNRPTYPITPFYSP